VRATADLEVLDTHVGKDWDRAAESVLDGV
jgi:hypothetical protein